MRITCKTVGELIEQLSKLDKAIPVLVKTQHMEKGEYLEFVSIREAKYNEERKPCRDAFDGTCYTTEIKVESYKDEVTLCIVIS